MVSLLAKIFIKKDMDSVEIRSRYGMISSIVGILLNICLFAGKYVVGFLCGSIAIMADAFNNLSDAGSSVVTLLGFKMAKKKPDAEHPYGHGRIEYVSGLAVACLIIVMGIELLKTSIDKIINPQTIEATYVTVFILVVSIFVKMYMYVYNSAIDRKIDSSAMKATAMDSLSDTVTTSVVLITTLILIFTGINLDGFGGVVVALFILVAGVATVRNTLSPLLGQPPTKEFVEAIEATVLSYDEIIGIHDLMVHDYGPGRVFVSLHGEVSGNGDIFELHDCIDRIEKELKEKFHCEAVIHMDPIDVDDENVALLKARVTEIVKGANEQFTIHDFRIVRGNMHSNLIFDVVAPFDVKQTDEAIKLELDRLIREKLMGYQTVISVDRDFVKGK